MRVGPGDGSGSYWGTFAVVPGDDAANGNYSYGQSMAESGSYLRTRFHSAGTGHAVFDAGKTTAVGSVQASPRDGGRIRVFGSEPDEPRCRVRHLVIFRAPIVGFARPAGVGA
jgi:hypothetical protein